MPIKLTAYTGSDAYHLLFLTVSRQLPGRKGCHPRAQHDRPDVLADLQSTSRPEVVPRRGFEPRSPGSEPGASARLRQRGKLVWAAGPAPATSRLRTECSTKLSYTQVSAGLWQGGCQEGSLKKRRITAARPARYRWVVSRSGGKLVSGMAPGAGFEPARRD